MELSEKSCVPCEGDVPALEGPELEAYLDRVDEGWEAVDEHHITREFGFDDFVGALDFANRVGRVAEEEGHHPDLCISWGRAEVTVYTHAIDGLSENDFILASKIDRIHGDPS